MLSINLDKTRIKELLDSLPELPLPREKRFIKEYKLSPKEAKLLTNNRESSDYFEEMLKTYKKDSKNAANALINNIQSIMNEKHISAEKLFLTPERAGRILVLIDKGTINTTIGKELFRKVEVNKLEPESIVENEGLAQVIDSGAIESICQEVIQENPAQVEQYQSGKEGVIGWLIGQVMAKSGGKADPQVVRETIIQLLK